MALADVETTNSPTAKHRKSSFGFEPSYEKRWDSVIQLQAMQKKTPHRYQQSPVFSRKVLSCPAEEVERRRHHRHPHRHHDKHQHTHGVRRRHKTSESDSHINKAEERVHLLAALPWRKSSGSSDNLSDSSSCGDENGNRDFLLQLPNELDNKLNSQMHRTRSTSPGASPLFLRREKQRARSQGSSPISYLEELSTPAHSNVQYNAKLLMGVYPINNEPHRDHILTPEEDVVTPQPEPARFIRIPSLEVTADLDEPSHNQENVEIVSNGLLEVPTLDGNDEPLPPPPSPETLRRFLGLETEPIPERGLSEQELIKSRLMTRRFSSSSDSSTSTLT